MVNTILQAQEATDAIAKFAREFGLWAALFVALLLAVGYYVKKKMDSDTKLTQDLTRQLVETAEHRAEEDRKAREEQRKEFLNELAATRKTYLEGQAQAIQGQNELLKEIREIRKKRVSGGNQ